MGGCWEARGSAFDSLTSKGCKRVWKESQRCLAVFGNSGKPWNTPGVSGRLLEAPPSSGGGPGGPWESPAGAWRCEGCFDRLSEPGQLPESAYRPGPHVERH
eukprot:15471537-Alexandrium_andersonii.AAC.1